MRAVVATGTGGPEVLVLGEVPSPTPGPGEVLIAVAAAALNLADVRRRQGAYIMSSVAGGVLGLECSGRVAAVGEGVSDWRVGDAVCALLGSGGYADLALAPAAQILPVPEGLDLVEAASLPEAAATVWSNLWDLGGLRPGHVLLVHGGAGGIGSFAIQAGAALGARVFCTASHDRREFCEALGAGRAIDYREEDFVAVLAEATGGHGADVILDNMGGSHLGRNIEALAVDGRIVTIGLQGGREAPLNIGTLMRKRGSLLATSLSDRPPAARARIMAGVLRDLWPHVAAGRIRPVIDRRFDLAAAAEAHRAMEAGGRAGKLLLLCGGASAA